MAGEGPPRQAWVAWIAVCIIWGTTYLAIKVALETIPPFLMGGMRYLLAGAVLAAFVVARGGVLPDRRQLAPHRADWQLHARAGQRRRRLGGAVP